MQHVLCSQGKAAKEEAKALKEAFKPLTSWWKDQLASKVGVCVPRHDETGVLGGMGAWWGGAVMS